MGNGAGRTRRMCRVRLPLDEQEGREEEERGGVCERETGNEGDREREGKQPKESA